MKKHILLTTILVLLFEGCSYKNRTYSDVFTKEKEVNRDNCKKQEAIYDAENHTISLSETCKVTYEGKRTQKYDQYEFSFTRYMERSILLPLGGLVVFPISLFTLNKKLIKRSFIAATYPVSGLFYRPKRYDRLSAYELNNDEKIDLDNEKLAFNDIVKVKPDKEIWIGNDQYKYPLEVDTRYSYNYNYNISKNLVDFFCKNKETCNLNIYKRDNDKLKKFTTIKMKDFQ